MAKRRTPPSGVSGARRRVDVREWLGGMRVSGFMLIMLGLVVLGVLVLVPTVGTYLDQRQRIAALEESVRVTQAEVDELTAEQARWNDPAYITTEAGERLYYFRPGSVVYLVENDLPVTEQPQEQAPVSSEVEVTETDWMTQLVRSVTAAGTAVTVTVDDGSGGGSTDGTGDGTVEEDVGSTGEDGAGDDATDQPQG